MTKYVQLPDGSHVGFPDEWDQQKINDTVLRDHGSQFQGYVSKSDVAGDVLRDVGSDVKETAVEGLEGAENILDAFIGTTMDVVQRGKRAYQEYQQPEFDAVSGAMPPVTDAESLYEAADKMGAAPSLRNVISKAPETIKTSAAEGYANIIGAPGQAARVLAEQETLPSSPAARAVWGAIADFFEGEKQKTLDVNIPYMRQDDLQNRDLLDPMSTSGAVQGGVESFGRNLIPVAAGGVGGANLALTTMGMDIFGENMSELEDKDTATQVIGSLMKAGNEVLLEKVPFDILFNKWGKDFGKELIKFAVAETGQEVGTETLNFLTDKYFLGENLTQEDYVRRMKHMLVTLPVAIGATGAQAQGQQALQQKMVDLAMQRDADKYFDQFDGPLKETAERQARAAADPQAYDETVVEPQAPGEETAPPAAGATARENGLQQTKKAFDELNKVLETEEYKNAFADLNKAPDEQELDAFNGLNKAMDQDQVDDAYAAREKSRKAEQAALEKQKEEDYDSARVQVAEEEVQQQQSVDKANEGSQAPTMESVLSQAFDGDLSGQRKVTNKEAVAGYEKSLQEQDTGDEMSELTQFQAEGAPDLVHYSRTQGITEIDPDRYGEGMTGGERKRKAADPENWVNRSYFYVGEEGKDFKKEPALGPVEYRVSSSDLNLYDTTVDPEGFKEKSKGNRNLQERMIRDSGYDGAIFDAPQGRAAMVFKKTTPKRNLKTARPGGGSAEFFTKMTLGEDGVPNAEYKPVLDRAVEKNDFLDEYQKHRGNFDSHIAASIPGFRDVQVLTGDALAQTLEKGESVLDIRASEGSWAKTLTVKSGAKTVAVDPLPAMKKHFDESSKVPGATFEMKAFGDEGWTESDGTRISPFHTTQKFDVVHESMAFQFIDNDRAAHIKRAKKYMKPDGILIAEEKFKDDGTQEYKNREAQKDAYKAQYFTEKAIKDKEKDTLVVGMNDNMVTQQELEDILSSEFEYVAQYWSAGNFGGYIASDDFTKVDEFLEKVGDTNTQYSATATPRWVKDDRAAAIKPQADTFVPEGDLVDSPAIFEKQAFAAEDALQPGTLSLPNQKAVVNHYGKENGYLLEGDNLNKAKKALNTLKQNGMPIDEAFAGIRGVFWGTAFAVKGKAAEGKLPVAYASAVLTSEGDHSVIGLGARMFNVAQGGEQGMKQFTEYFSHEITHTIDYGHRTKKSDRPASETSPEFELDIENMRAGPVIREMWVAYRDNLEGLRGTLSYPFDAVPRAKRMTEAQSPKAADLVDDIKSEAFAQLGMLFWGRPNQREAYRAIMPKAIQLMERIDGIIRSNPTDTQERTRQLRELLRADKPSSPEGGDSDARVPKDPQRSGAQEKGDPGNFAAEEASEGRNGRNTGLVKSYERNAQKVFDLLSKPLSFYTPVGRLPGKDEYIDIRGLTLGKISNVERITEKVYNTFRDAPEDVKQEIFTYMTTAGAPPETISEESYRFRAVSTKKLINRVGKTLAEKGLVGYESIEENADAYLPRIYLRHILDKDTYSSLAGGKVPSSMGYAKERNKELSELYRRIELGEIQDPGFLASRALGTEMRDIAIMDFLEEISLHEDWVYPESVVKWQGRMVSIPWLKDEADAIERQAAHYKDADREVALDLVQQMKDLYEPMIEAEGKAPGDYKRVPANKRFGRLRGMLIRKEIYTDLMSAVKKQPDLSWFGELVTIGGLGTKLTQKWKLLKVPMNPPSQVRNAISNMILLHMSGMRMDEVPVYVIRALQETRKKGKYYRIARKRGVTESTFTNNEVYRAERDILDLLDRTSGNGVDMATINNVAGILADVAGDTYQFMESVGKTAKIMHAMEKEGMTESKAVAEAQKWLFDYSLVPSIIRDLRNSPFGMPFITFYYKVFPRLAETAVVRPWKFALYYAIPHAFAMLFQQLYDIDDDDFDKLMAAMPDWIREKGHALILPLKDEQGRWQVYDFSYLLPWSMFNSMGHSIADMDVSGLTNDTGLFSAPISQLIVALRTNVDPWSQQPIVTETASAGQKMYEALTYLYGMMAPSWLTNNGFAGKIWETIDGEVDPITGEHPLTVGQSFGRLVGQNVYPFEPDITRMKNIRRQKFEIQEMKSSLRRALRNESDANKRKEIREDWLSRIREKADELGEYQKESRLPSELR